jgi:ferredoxin-NADP reductase/hemoglobin-like flavoprotein
MTLDPRLIHRSFALVEESTDEVVGHFFALLFLTDPGLRDLFPPMMDAARDRLLTAVLTLVHHSHEPHTLVEYFRQLGLENRKFGVRPENYHAAARCLIAAMKRFARPGWTPEMDAAWGEACRFAGDTMIRAAHEAAKSTPAWWAGRVVEHRRPTDTLALITVEPNHPYPFRPGQYAAVETLRWPRVWRSYSIANAPRPDGLLTFQVRAIDGGWVSTALVQHLRVGDTLRLGPAVGSLSCDSASMRDVLMIGGGTGIAPLMAIVEDMGRWNTSRKVTFFYGVRKAEDLCALAELEGMRVQCPWLTVVPCVSHDAEFRGEQGMLPDVVTRHGAQRSDWAGHDVLVSGSAPMIRAALARLVELNVPGEQIKYDAFGEQADLYLGLKRPERTGDCDGPSDDPEALAPALPFAAAPPRKPEPLPVRKPSAGREQGRGRDQASKSSATSSDVGTDWQVNTNPSFFSSGSRA